MSNRICSGTLGSSNELTQIRRLLRGRQRCQSRDERESHLCIGASRWPSIDSRICGRVIAHITTPEYAQPTSSSFTFQKQKQHCPVNREGILFIQPYSHSIYELISSHIASTILLPVPKTILSHNDPNHIPQVPLPLLLRHPNGPLSPAPRHLLHLHPLYIQQPLPHRATPVILPSPSPAPPPAAREKGRLPRCDTGAQQLRARHNGVRSNRQRCREARSIRG